MAPDLDQSARADERAQPALERRAFVARDAKDLQQFLDGGGVIDPVADEPEHFLFGMHEIQSIERAPGVELQRLVS